jgi:hypothetical protein
MNRVWRRREALEERSIGLVRHDRGPFVDRRANAAEVIPVMVHGDDIANRLTGNQLFGFREDG